MLSEYGNLAGELMGQVSTNRSLRRTADILDVLEYDQLTLSEISRRTEISISSTHRLMESLEELGFVRRDVDGRFSLGRRFQRTLMETTVRQTLARVRDETGESCQFWIQLHHERLCVAIADSGHELRPILAEGTRIPLEDGGSAGRIFADEPRAVESLKKHGWVESINDRTPGISSLSIPLIVRGRMQGVVCSVLPSSRVKDGPGPDLGNVLTKHVERLRKELAALM